MRRILLLLFSLTLTAESFGAVRFVQTTASSGAGSFLHAMENAVSGDTIAFDIAGEALSPVVTLAASLPLNTKDLTIEGNGITLSGGPSRLRTFCNATDATVIIRRVHFTKGYLINEGNLTLQSCIFSEDQSPAGKGAIGNDNGRLIVQGCTFFGNTSTHYGAAIYTTGEAAEVSLTGNLFLNNVSAVGTSIYHAGGTITSGGYNALDYRIFDSEGYFRNEDIYLPTYDPSDPVYWFSPLSFRIMQDFIFTIPRVELPRLDYPREDFYGEPISTYSLGQAFSGAVQSVVKSQGYILHYSVLGNADIRVETIGGAAPDEDGIIPESTIAILRDDTPEAVVLSWTVNGVAQPIVPLSEGLEVYMSGHQRVELTVYRQRIVTQPNDAGEGSLRETLLTMQDYDIVRFAEDLTGKTIRLNSALPAINKHFVRIEGVGLTLASNARPLLSIDSVSAHIRGIRFTPDAEGLGNETENLGGVVRNNGGDLTIHACIFSGNTSTTWEENGGALYNNAGGKMSVAACTFYNNAAFRGGAIYNAGELELLGNIFFGNQAPIPGNGKTLFNSDGTVTATYNLYDVDGAGYSFETDNTHSAAISFSPTTFEPTPDNLLSETFGPPSSYPEQDYYGESFEWSVFPGAVKRTHAEGRILLWESVGQGTVELVVGPVPDAVGLVPKGSVVIFHAIPQGAGDTRTFRWEVNGQQHAETGDLTLTIDTNTFVSAVFNRIYTVTTTEDSPQGGQGTLRNYLFSGWQGDGDIIRFADDLAGKTIVLSTNFPEITHQIIVEGNGITLDGSNLTAPMFNLVAGSSATFNRIRFTGVSLPESASESIGGAAFVNHGQLTLNNCIFDDNHAAGRLGGAVYNDNLLIINACTFCGNVAQAGGAIYAAAGVILTAGNVFYNNTAPTSPDICEVTPQRNNHRHDQYLADPILDMETFIPHDGGRFIPYAEMVSLFGFPSVDFYNTLRNTRTVTSAGAAVRPSVVSFETQYADVIPSRIVERGSFLDEPSPQPQRAGYLFVGWFEDLAGAYRWNFELRPTTMETLTLYARWQDLLTFPTVTFRFGNGKPDSITYPSPATSLVEPPADPSRPYYIFTGWFANEGCTVLWDFLTVVTANTTLYAGWKPRSFTVVFDPRDGSPPVSLETTYAAPLVPPAITPKGNSQVTGWLADTLSSVLWNFTTMRVTADMTLYAFWTPPLKSIAIPSSPSVSLTPTAFSETVRLRGACGRRIGVYTSSGRLILSRRLGTDDEFVNTSAFPSGLYFFVLSALDVKESVFFKAVKR